MARRRQVLGGLFASALAGCTRSPGGRRIEGAIVGGAHQRGHRIREGFRPAAPSVAEETRVAVVGAGISGLSAAWALERAGLRDFLVLELEDAPGGTARSGRGPVSPYPWAAHYVPVPSPEHHALVALLQEVGAVAGRDAQGHPVYQEHVLCREPEERLFFRGEWYEGLYPRVGAGPADLGELERFEREMKRWAAWRDGKGRRAFDLPRRRGTDEAEVAALDRLSMADWLRREGYSSERLRWFVEYGCRDDFGATLTQTSAWAGIHYFASRLTGREEPAPLLTWPEGNGHLVAHLAAVAGPRLRTGALVTAVDVKQDAVEVTWLDTASGRVRSLRAAHAVLAAPRFLARHLVTAWRASPPSHLASAVYGAWMVANLTLRDRPHTRGFGLAWDNVLYHSPSLGYVVATHQSGRDHGATVWTYYLPLLDDDPARARQRLLDTRWEEWVDLILADLGPPHPGLRELLERVDVYLWGHAMVRPRPGYLWSPELHACSQPLGRLRFAHTDLSGMALFEEAQDWGLRAAASILRDEGVSAPAWLT